MKNIINALCLVIIFCTYLIIIKASSASEHSFKYEDIHGFNYNSEIRITESDLYKDVIGKSEITPWSWDWQPYHK